jgi:hypothetical protein
MYMLRSSEGEFSSGTRVEVLGDFEQSGMVPVRTVGKIQRYKTASRWNDSHTKQVHTKVEDGKAKQIEFTTAAHNLVKLRVRSR